MTEHHPNRDQCEDYNDPGTTSDGTDGSDGNDSGYYNIFNEDVTASETTDGNGEGGEYGISSILTTATTTTTSSSSSSSSKSSSQINVAYAYGYGYWMIMIMMLICPLYYYALLL